eukprot:CAMPEP_0115124502 /NCGR_PEP_ID=MMETSP0227-20121206/48367_1 /TAXON_ID=89957 /ORGANISM="Polarella glacialis, Strain CCMP 1383" /LENGTH=53 /DNA_ID=CAMNT_0002527459 /DNA_START=256 /DNA_END=413 /DNA_ORIENTATION=+
MRDACPQTPFTSTMWSPTLTWTSAAAEAFQFAASPSLMARTGSRFHRSLPLRP